MAIGSNLRPLASLSASADEVNEWLDAITYKPGWTFDVEVGPKHTLLVVRAATADSRGGEALVVTHRFTLPGRSIVGDQRSFVGWIRHVLGKVELHERDEWLLVERGRIFDPHSAIDLR